MASVMLCYIILREGAEEAEEDTIIPSHIAIAILPSQLSQANEYKYEYECLGVLLLLSSQFYRCLFLYYLPFTDSQIQSCAEEQVGSFIVWQSVQCSVQCTLCSV